MHKNYCFNCDQENRFNTFLKLEAPEFSRFVLLECQVCKAVAAFHQDPEDKSAVFAEYENYNHLSKFSIQELVNRSKKLSLSKKRVLNEIKDIYGLDVKILDLGGGAGIFVKSCHNLGFKNTYLFEPSKVLGKFAQEHLDIPADRVVSSIEDMPDGIDVVTMFDVIEHLPIDGIRSVFAQLIAKMSPGASVLGVTPNIKSFNISLHKERDPVIAPPSHTIYFSKEILDDFFTQIGFTKHKALTIGLSINSFFRPTKFTHSWVERPYGLQKVPAILIRLGFKALGLASVVTHKGYHCFFWYRRPK